MPLGFVLRAFLKKIGKDTTEEMKCILLASRGISEGVLKVVGEKHEKQQEY